MTTEARPTAPDAGERDLVAALQEGSEAAFAELVDRYGASMLRIARLRVPSEAVAEEVVQETWLQVLRGLPRFEARSSLRTWIFVILANCASRRARLEGRSVPFASLTDPEDDGPTVSPDLFFPADHPRWPACWSSLVDGWAEVPDDALVASETRGAVRRALDRLPEAQRLVMTLRDVEGWSAEEVCAGLELTPENQRVLLHRARARVRATLAGYFEERRDG
jgi:RNA polymerase sigma-70 factor (ECF subfamily)